MKAWPILFVSSSAMEKEVATVDPPLPYPQLTQRLQIANRKCNFDVHYQDSILYQSLYSPRHPSAWSYIDNALEIKRHLDYRIIVACEYDTYKLHPPQIFSGTEEFACLKIKTQL